MDNADKEGRQADSLRQELVEYLKKQGHIQTSQVEQAFRTVPRHLFLPGVELQRVYSDTYVATKLENDIPISSSSQPAIMAYMLEQLDLRPGQRVLEIGAGTGYNAALMAYIVGETGQIVTIDIDEDIVEAARAHLQAANFPQVQVIRADGSAGYPDLAPYDRIILTVSADDITPAWREQLKQGGILVLPFKFTQFYSLISIPALLPAVDQVVLKLRSTGDSLESIGMRGAGFMPLRGAFAVHTGRLSFLDPERKITLACLQDRMPDAIAMHIQEGYNDLNTGVSGTYTEFWGLRMWLVLRDPAYCELLGKGEDGGQGQQLLPLPSIAQLADSSTVTYGLCTNDTLSLLMRQKVEVDSETDYWLQPFELILRNFGPDNGVAQRLLTQIKAWEEAGRPFQWHSWDLLQNIKIHVYPLEGSYQPGPHELLSERKGSRFVFKW
jgi:protein-L-isoaspartate(D-aspartate) O-methyltransferase